MKILLIHGENVVKSRDRLNTLVAQYRNKGWEVIKTNTTDELFTASLFTENRLYVIEDIGNLNLKSLSEKYDTNIVIWHDGNVNSSVIRKLPKSTKVEKFDLPKIIFKFLDSFYPENAKTCLSLLHEVIKSENIEFVLALLARQLRDLYWVKADFLTLNYPSWRVSKLKKQWNNGTMEQLKELINLLAEIDIKTKTSQADLLTELDFIIVRNLE